MVELRNGPPHQIVEFFLDSAIEEGEIDGCTYATCRLYGDNAEMMAIADGPFIGLRARLGKCAQMDEIADRILRELPAERRGALLWEGAATIPRETARLVPVLAGWAVTDAVEGGCLLPFREDRPRARRGKINKGLWRHLCAPTFIRRYVKNNESAITRRCRSVRTMNRIRELTGDAAVKQDKFIRDDIVAQMNRRRDDPDYMDRMIDVINNRIQRFGGESLLTIPGKKAKNIQRRQRQKVIKRATKFAVDVIGPEAVSALAHGAPVRLPGNTVQIEVTARSSLALLGHGGLSVAVLDLEGKRLADLCLYYEDTPVIDQVSALALQLQAGLEQEIVADANIILTQNEALSHPIFAGHKDKKVIERVANGIDDGALFLPRGMIHPRESQQREQAYWDETQTTWIEATTIFTVGAKAAKSLLRLVTDMVNIEQRRLDQYAAIADAAEWDLGRGMA